MAKAKQHIKVYTNADKALYQIAYMTGGFTKAEAKALGVSEDRLKQHIKQKNVVKERDYKPKKGQSEYIYNLTKQGKEKCREVTNVNNLYKRASERHDAALRKELISAYKEKEIVQFISEKDWNQRLEERIHELRSSNIEEDRREAERIEDMRKQGLISPPDGGYMTSDREIHAVEVVTRYYTEEEREAKQEFIRVMNITQYKEIDIN